MKISKGTRITSRIVGGIEIAIGVLFFFLGFLALIATYGYYMQGQSTSAINPSIMLFSGIIINLIHVPGALFLMGGIELSCHRTFGRSLNIILSWIFLVLGVLLLFKGPWGLISLAFGLALLLWLSRPATKAAFRTGSKNQDS